MNIRFGENFRRLRLNKGLTQENLADSFGVAFQTVSKWERNESYPDIGLLPDIASFFEVSIEDLLGVNNARKEQKLQEYLELFESIAFKNIDLVFTEFQKAVKEFPRDFRILVRYMELLTKEKDNVLNPDYEKVSREITAIYENIQKHCTDDSIRIRSKHLAFNHLMKRYQCTCDENGRYYYDEKVRKKAEDIFNTMPAMKDAKEYLALYMHYSNRNETILKYYENCKSTIEELLFLLQNAIISYCYYDDKFSPEYKIEVITHMNGLLSIIESDEYCGKNRIHLIYNYGHLGHLYAETGDKEKAFNYLKLSAEYAKKLDEDPKTAEKISLFYEREQMFREMSMSQRMKLLFLSDIYRLTEEFKESEEFQDIIKILDKTDTV